MARFYTEGIAEILADMKELGELTGPAAEEMLMAGAEEVKQAWRFAAAKHGHIDTGQMFDSIGYPRQPKDANGILEIDIYPQGKDKKGVRNAEKAFIQHYGTKSRPGSHWVDTADDISGPAVEAKMREIWDRRLKERGL